MFIYRGGSTVRKGSYWDVNSGETIRASDGQALPKGTFYFRTPHSYALVALVLLSVVASAALPYGIGLLLLIVGVAFIGALGATVISALAFMKSSVGRNASFDWRPSEAYLAGKKQKKSTGASQEGPEKKEGEEK